MKIEISEVTLEAIKIAANACEEVANHFENIPGFDGENFISKVMQEVVESHIRTKLILLDFVERAEKRLKEINLVDKL
jgi:hypothetical protein